jgi:hypothetical protein
MRSNRKEYQASRGLERLGQVEEVGGVLQRIGMRSGWVGVAASLGISH